MTADEEFSSFAATQAAALRRTAYVLCHDWHLAEDLTQSALVRLYVVWGRLDWTHSPQAYVRRILYREFLSLRRLRSSREVITEVTPQSTAEAPDAPADLRLTMLDALGHLPPRDRAIVVLRYWEDLSVEAVAETLGLRVGVVKSQSMRSLAKLRALLGDERFALFG